MVNASNNIAKNPLANELRKTSEPTGKRGSANVSQKMKDIHTTLLANIAKTRSTPSNKTSRTTSPNKANQATSNRDNLISRAFEALKNLTNQTSSQTPSSNNTNPMLSGSSNSGITQTLTGLDNKGNFENIDGWNAVMTIFNMDFDFKEGGRQALQELGINPAGDLSREQLHEVYKNTVKIFTVPKDGSRREVDSKQLMAIAKQLLTKGSAMNLGFRSTQESYMNNFFDQQGSKKRNYNVENFASAIKSIAGNLGKYDTDGDGKLGINEFVALLQKSTDKNDRPYGTLSPKDL